MATIGNFTANGNGFVGTVKTLALGTVKAKIVAAARSSDKAPDYRIFAGTLECGAAWKKKSQDQNREYLSVKLDDPSFAPRSTPRWSRWRARKATRSSGLARTATKPPNRGPCQLARPSNLRWPDKSPTLCIV